MFGVMLNFDVSSVLHPISVLSGLGFLSFSACLIPKFGSLLMIYSIAPVASDLCLETKHYLMSRIC